MEKSMSDAAVAARVKKMIEMRESFDAANISVQLFKGNSKTGARCHTVSLIPVADCKNCAGCRNQCYDVRNDCWRPSVMESRAKNSCIHKHDITRYWNEIRDYCIKKKVTHLRINVGGYLVYEDLVHLNRIAKDAPGTTFLFFTKNYDDVNQLIDSGASFEPNVRVIFSRWVNVACDNHNGIPESHVIYSDGSTTCTGEYFACPGNCTECFDNNVGCWALKRGGNVCFHVH